MIDENEIIPEGIIEDEEFKTDKIFDNQFEQTELDTTEKSFQIDPSFTEKVLDEKIDEVEKQTGINLLDLRVKILHGKSFHLTNDFWEYLRKTFEDYRPEALEYIFGGISFEEDKDKVIATLDSQS